MTRRLAGQVVTTSSEPRPPAAAHHDVESVLRLEPRGDLDYDTSPEFLREAAAALAGRGTANVLAVDCRDLGFVDSVGLSALLEIHRDAALANVAVTFTHIGPRLEKLLRITGTYTHLTGATAQKNTS
nr:STAS domain-containing protein [Streptomyces sp. SID8380]